MVMLEKFQYGKHLKRVTWYELGYKGHGYQLVTKPYVAMVFNFLDISLSNMKPMWWVSKCDYDNMP